MRFSFKTIIDKNPIDESNARYGLVLRSFLFSTGGPTVSKYSNVGMRGNLLSPPYGGNKLATY